MRDPDTGISRGFGFLGYDSFDSSDEAIKAMNGQYLCNHAISVTYALKKDSKEKHGTGAERLLAANRPLPASDDPTANTSYTAARFGTADTHTHRMRTLLLLIILLMLLPLVIVCLFVCLFVD